MTQVYLYKLQNCEACAKAQALLHLLDYDVISIVMDDPLTQLGNMIIFNDEQLHAPLINIPDKGFFILNGDGTDLIKIKV